ncbi:MAG: CAP domain-containing protein [Methanobrevibacter sp.]|nr:CAP domain-containing protein [Methanobrevibacter sp.]
MKFKKQFLKIIFIVLALFCVGIMPVIFAEEVLAASTTYENQVLDLVNKERSKVGVAPLKMDKVLSDAAKIRTKEVKRKFSHTRPNGSPYYSLSSKIKGENIANGQKTPATVMKAWMNSKMHKNNILNPKYKSIGIGYLKGTSPYWVQLFSNKKAGEGNNLNSVIKPKAPSFSLVSSKKSITIHWKKVSGASGYQIYRSTKINGNYSLKKTISKGTTIKYIDKNLNKKKYFYKIRTFTTIKGKREFSKFSSIQSKTPK